MESHSGAQCRDLDRGRRNRLACYPLVLQQSQKRQRCRGHGSVAHSRSAWIAQFESLPLGKRKSSSAANLKLDPESFITRILVAFGFRLVQLWARTLRYEVDARSAVLETPVRENYIGALWHNRLLFISYAVFCLKKKSPGAGLISASRDGDLVADLTKRFGFDVVLGSTSRLRASAMLELPEVLASGLDVLITPDWPPC